MTIGGLTVARETLEPGWNPLVCIARDMGDAIHPTTAPGPAADSRSAATSADTGPSKSEPELGQRAEPLQGLSEVRPLTTTPVEVVAAVA